jgi:hypothetical protein
MLARQSEIEAQGTGSLPGTDRGQTPFDRSAGERARRAGNHASSDFLLISIKLARLGGYLAPANDARPRLDLRMKEITANVAVIGVASIIR